MIHILLALPQDECYTQLIATSLTGSNIRQILIETGKNSILDANINKKKNNMKVKTISKVEEWRVNLTIDLTNVKLKM